ncbi:unnamed protein product [Periconia digitata]|uniref:Calpain catalytic domain-containing protein n=1 Tax=Periconia digitata TaxID=1303443 RepID=A0A9W4U9V3_9PLEO|nr:unnamed protein product [Periconia digitata]
MSYVGDDDGHSKAPQEVVEDFWEKLITKKPTKVTNIFPPSLYANLLPPLQKPGPATGQNAAQSYEIAAEECRTRVKRIVRECHRTNEKFTDPEFDIEGDRGINNCLEGLMDSFKRGDDDDDEVDPEELGEAFKTLVASKIMANTAVAIDLEATARALKSGDSNGPRRPSTVHRIDWIFDEPAFTVDGYSSSDVQQGANGDCWFIAAVASICSNPTLMDRICVERDEQCGVYGFVFYRDGEWIWTVVDDNLYLKNPDFEAFGEVYDATGTQERKWKKNEQTGSDALYFASCADQNETWLPLLEKAYAKVHGDYDSIAGGITGEAIEDLTGGVTTNVLTNRILSKERLWKELLGVNKNFLFSASSHHAFGNDKDTRKGLALGHAYSVIKAVEEEDENGKKHRLVQIRNPWGKRNWKGSGEWNGAWSDGSEEWTPYWMKKLNHRFADDGLFWMSFNDLQKRFYFLDRTRLFNKDWTVVQKWTSVDVAWVTGYMNTKFIVEIKKAGPTVFVLSQLDDRYFKGLEGKYSFDLHFLLQEEGASPGDHIVRARGAWFGNRSISAEIDLGPGRYQVLPKISAFKDDAGVEVADAVMALANTNPQKLRQIGLNYDIANARGIAAPTEEEKKKEAAEEETRKKKKLEAEKERAEFDAWRKEKREREENERAAKEKKEEGTQAGEEKTAETNVENKKGPSVDIDEEKAVEATRKDDNPEGSESDDEDAEGESHTAKADNHDDRDTEDTDDESHAHLPSNSHAPAGFESYESHGGPAGPVSDSGSDEADEKPTQADDKKQRHWNAVCVMGLRVYSQDPEVSIKLVKGNDPEEGAVLDAGSATAAGATM